MYLFPKASNAKPVRGTPRNRLCRAAGVAPSQGVGEAKRSLGVEFVDSLQAATNSFHFLTMYSFSSITAFQQAMPPMRCS